MRLSDRSGVSDGDVARPLPGDALVAAPTIVFDRATELDAPPAEVWPWIVQLGKRRGGWYMPRAIEPWLVWDRRRRAATAILPSHQGLAVGDRVPDYGPSDFVVALLDAPRALVYEAAEEPRGMAFSWALVLSELPGARTRLHLRLRIRRGRGRPRATPLIRILGGLFDYATVELMFAGLRERVARGR